MGKYTVSLKKIAEEMKLSPLNLSSDYETAVITTADINRPAMQLTGFYDYFDPARIQIIGRVETTYLETLTLEQREKAFEDFMAYNIAALVICHECAPFEECLEAAKKYDRNVFITEQDTSEFSARLIDRLHRHLAPRITRHGVLVEVYGEGVLITGESGMGKSETALELVKRGHRLIADDAVEIKIIGRDSLVGSAPEMIRYYMELRGIGVINVRHIYGVGAVKPESSIDVVVHLEPWDDKKAYDRLGIINETENILGVDLPRVTIPVMPGRNLAVIMELAAMNNRQKKMGFNAAETLVGAHDAAVFRISFTSERMKNNSETLNQIIHTVGINFPSVRLLEYEPMHLHCSFRTGGPVRVLALPQDEESLVALCTYLSSVGITPCLLGNGTNVVFPDEGVDSLFVISTGDLQSVRLLPEGVISASAGLPLSRLAAFACEYGLAGLEFASGSGRRDSHECRCLRRRAERCCRLRAFSGFFHRQSL